MKWSWVRVPRLPAWNLDRNWHRTQAERHLNTRNWSEAERHLSAAVAEADQRNANPAQLVRLRLELAEVQRFRARPPARDRELLQRAERTTRAALDIAARAGNTSLYVNALDVLAEIFCDLEYWTGLEKVAQEAVRLGASLPHPDPIRMARRVYRLGLARHKNGAVADAMPALEKAIQLHDETYGPEAVETAALLSEAGRIYRAQGDHAKAQECLRRALRVHETEFGPDSPDALEDLQHLAGSLEDSGDQEGAAQLYERTLVMKLRKIGAGGNLEQVAEMQYSLANLHVGWGNLSRARDLLMECIGAFRGQGGPRLAVAYEMLAQVEERSGRFHCAIKELEQAAKVWERCVPSRRNELISNMLYRADLLDQARKSREASWLRERAAVLQSGTAAEAQSA